jgi:hypothetical protein
LAVLFGSWLYTRMDAQCLARQTCHPLEPKSKWVRSIQRSISHIRKQINPPLQPNWIGGDVSAGLRVVISEVVVMEACFWVVVLAREAEGILNSLDRRYCLSKGGVNRFPGDY